MDKKKKRLATFSIGAVVLAGLILLAYAQLVMAASVELTEDEAKAIAEEETGGIAQSVTLEKEGGKQVYEVQVKTDQGHAEVEIDANTGEVLEVEKGKDKD
jgi:uncharacterized membrane protein YkoI